MADKPAWAVTLAEALDEWCRTNGYKFKTQLKQELAIPDVEWRTVSDGKAVLTNNAYYARIFLRTGLTQADPRLIPARIFITPRGSTTKERKWSERELEEWLKGPDAQKILSEHPELRNTYSPQPETGLPPTSTVGGVIDGIITLLAHQLATQVVSQLDSRLEQIESEILYLTSELKGAPTLPKQETTKKLSLPALVSELSRHLDTALSGTPESRDEFVSQYGHTLGRILPALDALTKDRRAREEAVHLMRLSGGR